MGVRVDSQRADRYRTSAAILLLLSVSAQVYAASALNVVPWPATVAITNGTFALDAGTRVVPSSPALTSLAAVLTNEYRQAFGITVGVDGNAQGPGQIVLRLTEALQGEAYRLNVSTTGAVVEAGNYAALAAASVSLLQAADFDGYRVAVPCLSISDAPFVAYRGLMIDVARQPHSLDVLKQLVRLCRLYKIRYLQLHLTDDQGFKFPSTAFPLLTTQNYSGPAYTLSELRELERYSQERGVTIIPELEIPGHEAAMNRAMPDLFKIKDTLPYEHHATINWAKQEVMDALDVLIGEICSVFQATPYFHVGGDEADFEFAHQNTNFVQRFQALGYAAPYTYDDSYQLYRRLLRTLNELITTKYSKQMLCWEGFHRDPSSSPLEPIPHTLPVMAFENTYYPASQLVADGYPVINTAWNPLYVVNGTQCSPENIYGWNLYRFGRYQKDWSQVQWVTVSPTTNVIGAQMCAWEQPETIELDSLRLRVAAMSERIWNPNADKTFADFSQRVLATDTLLSRLTGSPVNPAPAVTQTTSGIVPLTVTFTDPAGGSATNRYWNFGDGTWANTASSNAVHVYTNTGTYTVTLVASGPQAVSSNAWENLIIVYAPFMNAIPYQITFEPPGMNAGDSLFVPLNSNGWYGASGTEAHVTNLVYAWPSWAYPVSTATHSNVLTYQSALFSNRLAQASSPAQTVIDLMSRPGTLDARPDTNALADVHGGVFIDTNGHINAWCSGDQSHSNRTWLTYANTPVGATNWARLTVTFDYAGDKTNGLTYYSVALNGVALTVPGGAGYAKGDGRFLRSPSGTWLVSANPDAKRLNSVTFAGTGCLDDLVVSDELRMRPHTVLLIR